MATQWNRFGQAVADLPAAPVVEAAKPMTAEERFALITRSLQEHTKDEILMKILREGGDPKIYWGTATTGKPHMAYFVPMSKISDFLRAGCEVTILLADVHAYLDNMKAPWELLAHRIDYYKNSIIGMLTSIGVPIEKLTFVVGSSYQLGRDFALDGLKMCTLTSQHDAQKAGAEVVKQSQSPPLSGLLYPLYQWLDEEYLGCDAQFGGIDQRKIFMGAEKYMPKLGYKVRAHLMNKMVPGLTGDKMSASDPASKIDLLEPEAKVKSKLKKVFCEEGNIEKNPLLDWISGVFFIIYDEFRIPQREADDLVYKDFASLQADFRDKKIHPGDLKQSVQLVINKLLAPIRAHFSTPEMQAMAAKAYPEPTKEDKKKEKKQKSKGGGGKPKVDPSREVDVSRLDLRVGKVLSVSQHPDAEKLYVEQIDCGDDEPRTVVSGLVGKVPMAELEGRLVVVCCNLKPSKMRGVVSQAMVLCASTPDKTEPLDPPAGSAVGERVTCEGFGLEPDTPHMNPKHKIWEALQPDLATLEDRTAAWKGQALVTSKGAVSASTLAAAPVR